MQTKTLNPLAARQITLAAASTGLLLAGLAVSRPASAAEEMARVISSTPIMAQVAVPRQVCSVQPVLENRKVNGAAGAIFGGIVGGALGNAVGRGDGNAVATAVGALGGAVIGHQIASNQGGSSVRHEERCQTQTTYENRITAYTVVYEYAGKQYTMQTPQDPGKFVRINVSPAQQGSTYTTPHGSAQPIEEYEVPTRVVYERNVYPAAQPVIVYRQPGQGQYKRRHGYRDEWRSDNHRGYIVAPQRVVEVPRDRVWVRPYGY